MLNIPITYMDTIYTHKKDKSCYSKYLQEWAAGTSGIKVGLGKLAMSRPLYPEFARLLQERGFQQLGISYRHASEVARLPWHHRDPFDRLLIAQALVENLPIVSIDAAFDTYAVTRLW